MTRGGRRLGGGGGDKVAVNVLNRRYYYLENKAGSELSDIWVDILWGLFAGWRKSHLEVWGSSPRKKSQEGWTINVYLMYFEVNLMSQNIAFSPIFLF